ncbi:hypothetical protein DVH05_024725 [Phytophthora capsici]|nr:hypothetical protein DVH05_024725 [Phytophthora capsici]
MNPDAGDDGDDNDLAIDDVVYHWETVLSAMEEGDDSELQALLDMVDVIHRNEAGLAANEEEKDEEEEEEDIRPPERLPFPEQDDKHFHRREFRCVVCEGARYLLVGCARRITPILIANSTSQDYK